MLPDFPSLKRELTTRLAHAAQSLARDGSPLRDTPSFRQHEGNRTEVVRTDGSISTMTYETPLVAQVAMRVDDARRHGSEASVRAARAIGEQFSQEMSKRMIETLTKAVDSVGNAVDAQGRPFSPELLAEVLEKMELSFDAHGEWQPPTMIVHPTALAKIKAALETLDADASVKTRIDGIVNRKREEWRAREARRILAD